MAQEIDDDSNYQPIPLSDFSCRVHLLCRTSDFHKFVRAALDELVVFKESSVR